MHEGLSFGALLEVLAPNALADGRAHDLRLKDEEKVNAGVLLWRGHDLWRASCTLTS